MTMTSDTPSRAARAGSEQSALDIAMDALFDVRRAIFNADPKVLTDTLWMPDDTYKGGTVVDFIENEMERVRNARPSAAGLGEMIYRALYEHEGGLWSAVDDRYKETVWNAAGRRLDAMLASAPASPPAEALPSQTSGAEAGGDLDSRMKAAGMIPLSDLISGNTPLERWSAHTGVSDLATFEEWLTRKQSEFGTMRAGYELGDKDKDDDLYEWVLAHFAAFNEVAANLRQMKQRMAAALSPPSTVGAEDEAVAWRVKDYADGWILCPSLAYVKGVTGGSEMLVQPLYTRPAPAADGQRVKALEELAGAAQEWCDAVDRNPSWDGWDHHFKNVKWNILPRIRACLATDKEGA